MELTEMFPDEQSAVRWFEQIIWPEKRFCPHCGSTETSEASHKKMPYWCKDCRSYFSVRTGSALQNSKLPLRKWAFAVYLYVTNLKGISSMKLHRELEITQKTAWFVLHRLREGWQAAGIDTLLAGPVETDTTYIGGKRKNMPKSKREKLTGRGAVGKAAVTGIKDRATNAIRAKVITSEDAGTYHSFVGEHTAPGATVYTDDATVYQGLPFDHESVNHSAGEYVLESGAHTNGIESFWAMFKRGFHGTYHQMSEQHLLRYVNEFAGRHNVREMDTKEQMQHLAASLTGKQLMYKDLTKESTAA